jgi:signal transduction histidine kinase
VAYVDRFPQDLTNPAAAHFSFTDPGGQEFSGFTMPVEVGGRQVYVQAVQTRAAADIFSEKMTGAFIHRLMMAGLPFYCGLLVVIVITLRHGLKPLRDAAEEAGRMDGSNLGLRIDEGRVPAEVLPFVRAVNFSFSRLSESVSAQQELTENVAHELRTPLTILKTRIDLLPRSEQSLKLSEDVDAMIKLVNQMLDATRLDYADMLEKKEVDLAEVLSQACQDFFPLFIRAGRALRVSGIDRPVPVTGNRDLIYRAICNLLDNALEYGPADTPVDALLEGYTISIRDYGRKIPPQSQKLIFERFRKDRSPSAGKSGAGLGLSIVTRTMELHGGYADLDTDSAFSGNAFRMVFSAP